MSARPQLSVPAIGSVQRTTPSQARGAAAESLTRWWPSRIAALAFAIGLVVTAALSITALRLYDNNENRLLKLRVRELNLVLAATAPAIQTPLASAAELADATGGSRAKFRAFMGPSVGPGRQFVSASLWPLGSSHPAPSVVLGARPALASLPRQAQRLFAKGNRPGVMNLTEIIGGAQPKIGFEFNQPGSRGFAVYVESALPGNRRSRIESNAAFSDLDYAVYVGHSKRNTNLVVTSVRKLPIEGRQASEVVPFGGGSFTLVVAPRVPLGGSFFHNLPWIIAVAGVLLSIAAALMTERLARRRRRAEELAATLDRVAAENRDMYAEQRSIAETLQRALLPDSLPEFPGLRVSALYVPAASGVEVGGDWYDVVVVDERRVLLLLGDVSGHGLRAATTMALLRHAALAYVAVEPRPASVLERLSDFVNRSSHDYFATVLCALIDVEQHTVTVASAGHIAPLLLDGDHGAFVDLPVDVPIGAVRNSHARYREAVTAIPASATLVAFTDGLVERRGEILDQGLARLRDLAARQQQDLEDLLATLARELTSDDHPDDTAIVGIQWQS